MCGRYLDRLSAEDVARLFGVPAPFGRRPRYNIAPTQEALIVRLREGDPEATMARWGLVPASFPSVAAASRLAMFNARGETAAGSRAFGGAYRRRRCLVPASGYYEWRRVGDSKQPYWVGLEGYAPLAFAGLWERWRGPGGELESFAILTTRANEAVEVLHERMPVILDPADYRAWLDADASLGDVAGLLAPFPARGMDSFPVGREVGSVRVDHPGLARSLV